MTSTITHLTYEILGGTVPKVGDLVRLGSNDTYAIHQQVNAQLAKHGLWLEHREDGFNMKDDFYADWVVLPYGEME